jgi:hypothetical protein
MVPGLMNRDAFDTLARSFAVSSSRRDAMHGFVTALGIRWTATFFPGSVAAKNKKRKKPKKNEFGCLNVGQQCSGKDSKCCSGICQGKKPKKGKKDKSTCIDHNAGACSLERNFCDAGQISANCGSNGICAKTTGNASFCLSSEGISQELNCRVCSTDRDCEAQGFPLGSACVIFTGGTFCLGVSDCAGVNGSTGTACFARGA